MRGRSDVGNFLEERDILRIASKFVIADQQSVGIASERSVLFLVNLFEQFALIELGSLLEVVQDFILRDVHQPHLQTGAGVAVHHEVTQTAP